MYQHLRTVLYAPLNTIYIILDSYAILYIQSYIYTVLYSYIYTKYLHTTGVELPAPEGDPLHHEPAHQ